MEVGTILGTLEVGDIIHHGVIHHGDGVTLGVAGMILITHHGDGVVVTTHIMEEEAKVTIPIEDMMVIVVMDEALPLLAAHVTEVILHQQDIILQIEV